MLRYRKMSPRMLMSVVEALRIALCGVASPVTLPAH
jgi:hypothetical protein